MNLDRFQRAVLAELGLDVFRPLAGVAVPGQIDSALLARLARAAGIPEECLLERPQLLVQAQAMGVDPRARRALWAELRSLRRGVR